MAIHLQTVALAVVAALALAVSEAVASEVPVALAVALKATAVIAICSVVPDSPQAQATPLLSVQAQVAVGLQRVIRGGDENIQTDPFPVLRAPFPREGARG